MGGARWVGICAACALLLSMTACDDDDSGSGTDTGGNADTGGDTGGGGDTTGGGSALENLCAALCSSGERCDPDNTADTCEADCVADPSLTDTERFLDAFVDAFTDCVADRDCSVSTESCLADGYATLGPDFQQNEPFVGCMSRRDECAEEFNDDTCFDMAAYQEPFRAQAVACLESECTAISDCIDGL